MQTSTQAAGSAVASPGLILSTHRHLPVRVRLRPARRFPRAADSSPFMSYKSSECAGNLPIFF
jgi:hypothetical protein